MISFRRSNRALLGTVLLVGLAGACASEREEVRRSLEPEQVVRTWKPTRSRVETSVAGERLSLGRLAVLPFFRVVGGGGDSLTCDVCLRSHNGGANPADAAPWMDEELNRALPDAYLRRSVPRDLAAAAVRGKGHGEVGALAPTLEELREVGRLLKADTVLVGFLFRFRAREGTDYGVRTPASVAFELALVRVADGDVLWRGAFDETQESLSENLLKIDRFIQNRGRWAEAGDLAAFGLKDLLGSLPKEPA